MFNLIITGENIAVKKSYYTASLLCEALLLAIEYYTKKKKNVVFNLTDNRDIVFYTETLTING